MKKKDEYYMELALNEAAKAFDIGEFPVGAVIEFDGKVVAKGSRVGTTSLQHRASEIDHAEIRALKSLEKEPNILLNKCTIYSTMEPCLMCFGAIIISGIKRVVYAFEDAMGGGTSCNLSQMPELYKNSSIEVVPHILRDKSLDLFIRFFKREDNLYWKDSYLEKYTLKEAKNIKLVK